MKSEVIEYILSSRNFEHSEKYTAYKQGLSLLYRLNPSHPLTNSAYTPHNLQQLIQALGYHLRTNQLIEVAPVIKKPRHFERSEKPPSNNVRTLERDPNEEQQEDHTNLSTEARINMDIHRMIKELRFFSRKLQAANSDHERKGIYKEANSLNDSIERNKSLLRQLQRGNKINYVNTYFEADGENDFDVPEKILDLDKKYRLMMARRSKRLAKVSKKEEAHGKDSPQHQQALTEWKHFDEVVKFLKTKLDEHK